MRTTALALLLAMPGTAIAGACCVGTTSTVPTQLGPCEHAAVGVGVTTAFQHLRWDSKGTLRSSSLKQQSLRGQLAASLGLGRRGFLSLRMPVLYSHARAGSASSWGGGFGDATFTGAYRVLQERPGQGGNPGVLVEAGVRMPTGRDWRRGDDPFGTNITGRPAGALLTSAMIQADVGKTPWSASVGTSFEPTPAGLRPTLDLSAGVGRYFGTRWSLLGNVSHSRTWTPSDNGWRAIARSGVGARIVRGERLAWRAWLGASSDLPIPGLGQEQALEARFDTGIAIVR